MTNFFQIRTCWVLPAALAALLPFAGAQTNTYTTSGVYTNTAPAGVTSVTVKLWGAGGGGGAVTFQGAYIGGGGAFSSVTLPAQPGDAYVIVVGQRGAFSSASLGGVGSGNTQGGAPGNFEGSFTNRAQGGQASSVFLLTNNLLFVKAIAGGGGGAGFGGNGGAAGERGQGSFGAIPGEPGTNGLSGFGGTPFNSDYNTNAIATGLSALNQAAGFGAQGIMYSGGGGGGFGGGGGGSGAPSAGAGGGGGGSYGTVVSLGSGSTPGNTSDANYLGNAGQGGNPFSPGLDGLAVVIWNSASPAATKLVNPVRLGDGSFRFSFTNVAGAAFTAYATTNIVSSSNWISLGSATETSPGQYQFTDPHATNFTRRFYQIRSP